MRRRSIRILLVLAAILPLLALGRLVTGGAGGDPGFAAFGGFASSSDVWNSTRRNYASTKLGKAIAEPSQAQLQARQGGRADQKYEKVAALQARSTEFERDEAAVRASIQRHGALVQFEQSRGLVGHRALLLSIGVPPPRFDAMLDEVRRIGKLEAIQVDKTDKTNEYRDLEAQRASLEKARTDLIALKERAAGARVDEQINLANRVLEIENEIQKLGVRLGEFDAENEFVTIRFTLEEARAPARVSLLHRAKVAAVWALQAYAVLLALALLTALAGLVIASLIVRLRPVSEAVKKQAQ